MNRRRTTTLLLVGLSLGILVTYAMYVATLEGAFEKAERAHHAEPPLGQTALNSYQKVLHQSRQDQRRRPQAMLNVATILDHGILQGPEPVMPDRDVAVGYYRQVAVMGSAREQAAARDRLIELGDRVFVNPPPRQHHPALIHPPPVVVAARAAADVRALENNGQDAGPRSDSQNVHESHLVKSVKVALDRLGPSPISMENTALEVRSFLENDENALKGLDLMETNTIPLTALKMTEAEVLRRVWGRIASESDESRRDDMKTMLRLRLEECGKESSCASGRVARVVDTLSTFDDAVKLRPLWALRQEMLAKAAALRNQRQEGETQPFVDVLRDVFTRDYVHTGLISSNVLDAELTSWGSDLE